MAGPVVHTKFHNLIVDFVNNNCNYFYKFKKTNVFEQLKIDKNLPSHGYAFDKDTGNIFNVFDENILLLQNILNTFQGIRNRSNKNSNSDQIRKQIDYLFSVIVHLSVDMGTPGQMYSYFWGRRDNYVDFKSDILALFFGIDVTTLKESLSFRYNHRVFDENMSIEKSVKSLVSKNVVADATLWFDDIKDYQDCHMYLYMVSCTTFNVLLSYMRLFINNQYLNR